MKIFKNIKFLFYVMLVLIIICDIMSLITSGKLTIEPATYALILVAICIEEVIYTRNKIIEEIKGIDAHIKLNDYLISTSNTKTRYLNTKPGTEAKAKESKSKASKAKTKSKTDKEILKDMLNGAK
ncbi:hypothetical protein ACNGEM_07475 [Campylobacter coli]